MKKESYHRCFGINFDKTIKQLFLSFEKSAFSSLFNITIKKQGLKSLFINNRERFVEICDFFDSDIVYLKVEDIDVKKTKELMILWQESFSPTHIFNVETIDSFFKDEKGLTTLKFIIADLGMPFIILSHKKQLLC